MILYWLGVWGKKVDNLYQLLNFQKIIQVVSKDIHSNAINAILIKIIPNIHHLVREDICYLN